MLFPKYEIDYFSHKISEIGKKSSGRAYFSRLRKIYKGEESWEVMYNEQDLILGKGTKNKPEGQEENKNARIPDLFQNKSFREDKKNLPLLANNNQNKTLNITNVSNKLDGVSLANNFLSANVDNDNIEETDLQELVFDHMPGKNIKEAEMEIDEKDYENFDYHSNHSDGAKETEYKNGKRTFTQAFGTSEEILADDEDMFNKRIKN